MQFAPDTSDAKNANMPGIDATDVSVSVESNTGEIVAEEFFKAGSRSSITVRVPRNKSLKVKVSFSGNHGMWEGEINRTITDSYIKAIVKMRKVSDAATASTNPEPKKSATTTTQTKQKTDREPVYFSKNDLATDKFKFFYKEAKKSYYNQEKKEYAGRELRATAFCRDNNSRLYVISGESDQKLSRYNSKGQLEADTTDELRGGVDIACDPITNQIYTLDCWEGPAGEEGTYYAYGIHKVKSDLSIEHITTGSNMKAYIPRPRHLGAYNGMLVSADERDPIFCGLYYVDLNSSNPKFTKVEFPANYEFRGGDGPQLIVNDLFMDAKYIYLIGTWDQDVMAGNMIVYEYKLTGSKGNQKLKVTKTFSPGSGSDNYWLHDPEDCNYNNAFYNPVKFVGYQNGYLYIADDGIEQQLVDRENYIYKDLQDVNRLATFDIKNKTLTFKKLSSVEWIEVMK